jgi:hypothetical protein
MRSSRASRYRTRARSRREFSRMTRDLCSAGTQSMKKSMKYITSHSHSQSRHKRDGYSHRFVSAIIGEW